MTPVRPFPVATTLLCLLALAHSTTAPAGDHDWRKTPDPSFEELRSRSATRELLVRSEAMIADWERRAEEADDADDDDLEDDLEDALEVLEYARAWLRRVSRPEASEREIFEANSYADRMLETVADPVSAEFLPRPGKMLRNLVFGSLFGIPAPRAPRSGTDAPLGLQAAKRESLYLHDPVHHDFHRPETLAELSAGEVARLDVSPANALWYDRHTLERLRPDPWGHFETLITRGMTGALREDDDLGKNETYHPNSARRVLFLEEVYRSGTSPKAHAEDAFGVEWKLKWGDEVVVEPVASRLYLMAGAKFTDYVATNGWGPDDCVLVLMDSEEAAEEREDHDLDDEAFPTEVSELAAAVDDFYGFRLDPYVHSHGVLTEANIDRLLRHLPDGGKKKYRKSKLIGRHWVAFRESSVELRTKGYVRRHDGSRLSDEVAVHDRAARGTFLFDMWIANRDAKSGNNKAFLLKESRDGEMVIHDYREGHHDLGLSLGSLWKAGAVNDFETGPDFLRRGWFGRWRFRQTTIFQPDAWRAATWADCRWMADHLARLSEAQIREAVAASGWPDFAREAMTYRLIERRDRIASAFGAATATRGLRPPSMAIPLGNAAEIHAAETRYELEPGSLGAELKSIDAPRGYREWVLHEGRIAHCRDSALVRLLVRQRFPSGLSTRYGRTGDGEPDCL